MFNAQLCVHKLERMKKIIIVGFLFFSISTLGQTKTEISNLAKLGKVWGFLKYYHPAVGKGSLNWDAELLRLVPFTAQQQHHFAVTLENWCRQLPEAKTATVPTQPRGDSILVVFSERDIQQFNLNRKLTQHFIKLYRYHLPDSNRFLTNTYKQYTLDFLLNKEEPFEDQPYPNRELRLLALFRYWNIISYQYPHKNQIKKSWNKVLEQHIPAFWQAKNKGDYRNAVQQLIAQTADSHSFYKDEDYNANQSFNVAFDLAKIKGRYVVRGIYHKELADQEGIKVGDEVIGINGMSVRNYERKWLFGVTGSTKNAKHRDQARQLLRMDSLKAHRLTVRRNGKKLKVVVGRYTWTKLNEKAAPPVKVKSQNWREVSSGIWHVKFCAIGTADELKAMFDSIRTAKRVIWDMRGYPVYRLLPQAFAALMSMQVNLGSNATANLFFPGTFTWRKDIFKREAPEFERYHGELIVLVNEQTQSLAESVSAQLALRPRTLIMGSQTAGTTGNINYIDLPGNIQVSFTAVAFHGAKASFVQNKGVHIDVRVDLNKRQLTGSTDILLQSAIRYTKIK